MVLGTQRSASRMLGKLSAPKVHPQPLSNVLLQLHSLLHHLPGIQAALNKGWESVNSQGFKESGFKYEEKVEGLRLD